MISKPILAALLIAASSAAALAQQPGPAGGPLVNSTSAQAPSGIQLPAEVEQVGLVDATMEIFLDSMKARTMDGLLEHGSAIVRRQYTTAQLNEAFKEFLTIGVSGKPIEGLAPIFTAAPERKGPSAFRVQGFYPTFPAHLSFDITYIREGSGWKWVAIFVRIAPEGQTGS